MQANAAVTIRYAVPVKPEQWEIPEGPVPEATAHDAGVLRIFLLLDAWAARRDDCRITRNLAVRWLEEYPRTGIDPDVCVLTPAPDDFDELTSLRLWEPARTPPVLCIEVVSSSHPYKDYLEIHERYAALGTLELLVFDPFLYGPKGMGGPVTLQLWRRDATGAFERVHFGNEPVFSRVLDAWISVESRKLMISSDRSGTDRWLTDAERARAEKERERAGREAAERRVQELELELGRNRDR